MTAWLDRQKPEMRKDDAMASCWTCGKNPTDCGCDDDMRALGDAEARVELEAERRDLRAELAALRQQLDEARATVEIVAGELAEERTLHQRTIADGNRLAKSGEDAVAHLADETALRHGAEADRDRLLVVYRAAEKFVDFINATTTALPMGTLGALTPLAFAVEDYRGTITTFGSAAPAEPAPPPEIGSVSPESLRLIDAVTGGGIRAQDFSVPLDDEDGDR